MENKEDKNYNALMSRLRKEPVLRDPDALTEEIMKGTGKESSGKEVTLAAQSRGSTVIKLVTRFLAAASVLILFTLGYEQFFVLKKISLLEDQHTSIANETMYRNSIRVSQVLQLISADPSLLDNLPGKTGVNSLKASRMAILLDIGRLASSEITRIIKSGKEEKGSVHSEPLKKIDTTDKKILTK